jgi:hypothetical protein
LVKVSLGAGPKEQAGYFAVSGSHLYTVLHAAAEPVARVLLVGPFAWERHSSYIPWVRWARYLAARGMECLRYDYRGIGESTGRFEDMSFEDWSEDVQLLAGWLNARTPAVPLALHGLEMGALLAGQALAAGIGDALLAWSAPGSANEVLRSALLRRVAVDNMFRYGGQRKGAADYIQKLETEPVEIEGYQWTSRLWRDSFGLELPFGLQERGSAPAGCGKPLKKVQLGKSAEPLIKGSMYISINPDLNGLFADNFSWIASALAVQPRSQ